MWYTTRKVRIQKHILLLSLSTKKQTFLSILCVVPTEVEIDY